MRHVEYPHVRAAVAAAGPSAHATINREAAAGAEFIVLAIPWHTTREVIAELGDPAGNILIDCTHPLLPGFAGLAIGTTTSAGEQVAARATRVRLVKVLNTTGGAK